MRTLECLCVDQPFNLDQKAATTLVDTLYAVLFQAIETHAAEQARNWLIGCREAIAALTLECVDFQRYFAIAQRCLSVVSPLPAKALEVLRKAGVIAPQCWTAGDYGRALMLLSILSSLSLLDQDAFIAQLYQSGDSAEQQAILRSLILLPKPAAQWMPIAIAGCRSHDLDVFKAVACENAYPATFFDEFSFNQLILKALFMGISTHCIAGLESRKAPTLQRMVADYVSERRAAGRSVPKDAYSLL